MQPTLVKVIDQTLHTLQWLLPSCRGLLRLLSLGVKVTEIQPSQQKPHFSIHLAKTGGSSSEQCKQRAMRGVEVVCACFASQVLQATDPQELAVNWQLGQSKKDKCQTKG
jgi:hypothetical protein